VDPLTFGSIVASEPIAAEDRLRMQTRRSPWSVGFRQAVGLPMPESGVEIGSDDCHADQDVYDREQLRTIASRDKIAKTDSRDGNRCKVDRVHPTPVLEEVIGDRPDRQEAECGRRENLVCVLAPGCISDTV